MVTLYFTYRDVKSVYLQASLLREKSLNCVLSNFESQMRNVTHLEENKPQACTLQPSLE